jgi:putative pyruvate formate lyase activating enzyme
MELKEVVSTISTILDEGINLLGFVSPSHFIPQMKAIIYALHERGKHPVVVYNSNAYDKVETLRTLEDIVDVYLPDFKYSGKELSKKYSDAPNYPDIALKAIKEMVRQKGTSLRLNDDGQAESGVIVRHLVLPGLIKNSTDALKLLAEEISPLIHISLMSQYYPTQEVMDHRIIGRNITKEEYETVVDEMERLGLHRGWLQEYDSNKHYKPDFFKAHPFE